MTEIEIKSAHSATRLRFSNLEGDYFLASLNNPEYSGAVRVWEYTESEGLAGLFKTLADDWRGWDGERAWSSIEGEFSITCSHDRLGHVTLDAAMHHDFGALEPWRVRGSIVVDAGQLDAIYRSVRSLMPQYLPRGEIHTPWWAPN
jgi:hypothetical protein